ncbi:MAG: tRNA (adenosine(37)-N6)-threonylcarbamoyltransferase complex ATPase subunit type 1 TsaE [bacterium]
MKNNPKAYQINSEAELPGLARELLAAYPGHRIFAFYGAMGAGKTTFIKAICRALGVEDEALSPTFAIINEYHTTDDTPVYHFDFYRVKNVGEIYDIGYEEYLSSGRYCLIEWPEQMQELLPPEAVKVSISGDGERTICF